MTALFYGVAGAHRTGKTTLAREVAAGMGLPLYETKVSATLRAFNINPQSDMPFDERLEIQSVILNTLLLGYSAARAVHPDASLIIVDRTPIDVLGYTMSEILRSTLTPELDEEMSRHEKVCLQAFQFNFAGACYVRPGIPIVSDDSKATPNIHYQRHVHACMIEAIHRPETQVPTLVLGARNLDLNSRVSDTIEHCEAILTHTAQTSSAIGARHTFSLH